MRCLLLYTDQRLKRSGPHPLLARGQPVTSACVCISKKIDRGGSSIGRMLLSNGNAQIQSVQEHGYVPETQFGAKNQNVKSLGEHLPSMDRTLSPIPDTTEREEKKKRHEQKKGRNEKKEGRKEGKNTSYHGIARVPVF